MNETSKKRIGLFGGTFNPIHLGHLRSTLEVKEDFSLDEVYFIPSAIPPHKETKGMVDAKHRLKMIRMAISKFSGFTVSDIELKRSGPSYTIDTLKHFKTFFPDQTDLYLILGMDAAMEIHTWKFYREFFDLVPLIVMTRPGPNMIDPGQYRKTIEEYLILNISEGYQYSETLKAFRHDEKKIIYLRNVTSLDISSSAVRHMIKQQRSPQYLIPETVEKYIKAKGLYL